MKQIITAGDAKKLSLESEAYFNKCLDAVENDIKRAAMDGNSKVIYNTINLDIDRKILDHLTILGYKISSYSHEIGNTAIHW